MRKRNAALLALALTGVTGACQDLNVTDENLPDTARALGEPAAVEAVIKSSFQIWFDYLHNYQDILYWFPMIADEMTSTVVIRETLPAAEPRIALKNDPLSATVWIPRGPWDGFSSAAANTNDALIAMNCGATPTSPCEMQIETVDDGATTPTDNTVRARAFAKIFQGVTLGYLGLSQDKAPVATEDSVLPKAYDALIEWEKSHLTSYQNVLPEAIKSIEEGIAIIDANPAFTLGTSWITGTTLTSAQLSQFAHSMIARLLVYGARTPAERAAVNWQKVLAVTEKGLTYDFGPVLQNGLITSTYLSRIQRTSDTQQRADYRLVGPADVSGAYQTWLSTPIEQRTRINITTPDRRIQGTTATSAGSYFRYRTDNNGFDASRGAGYFSAYQWYRKAGASNTGPAVLFSADENRLLRAEAFFRTGNTQEAANLVNVSRTRTQRIGSTNFPGLPAVTKDGVAQAADCVPRTRTGACGSLLDALMYERAIESAGADAMRAWFDNRGSGLLQPGTTLHMPVPGRYLVSLGLPIYSFGGVGGEGAAQ
jgi:hypothetical protein